MRDGHFTADRIAGKNGIDLPGLISAREGDALRSERRAVDGIGISDARLPAKHHLHGIGRRDSAGGRWPGRARLSHLDILPRLIKGEREDDEEDEREHMVTLTEPAAERQAYSKSNSLSVTPKARFILGPNMRGVAAIRPLNRAFSALSPSNLNPGALPQAVMRTRPWR